MINSTCAAERAALGDRDTSERLSPDDMATLRVEQHLQAALLAQHLQAALLAQRRQAEAAAKGRPGWCSNCGDACLPPAIYCDDGCKEDHQYRERVARKQGRR